MLGRIWHWLMSPPQLQQVIVREVIREVPTQQEVKQGPPVESIVEIAEDLTVFQAKNLRIYTYFNGTEMVKADPMVLFKKWMERAGDLDGDFAIIRVGQMGADEAYEKALGRIRAIFDIKPLVDGGLDEDSTFDLFYHFIRYIEEVKKNLKSLPTSPPTTESPPRPILVENLPS